MLSRDKRLRRHQAVSVTATWPVAVGGADGVPKIPECPLGACPLLEPVWFSIHSPFWASHEVLCSVDNVNSALKFFRRSLKQPIDPACFAVDFVAYRYGM